MNKRDLMEYLKLQKQVYFDPALPLRRAVDAVYREFYVFLGAEQKSNWYRDFVAKVQWLARGRNEQLCSHIAYLRTVEFGQRAKKLESELR